MSARSARHYTPAQATTCRWPTIPLELESRRRSLARRVRRKFTPEFKAETVKLVRESGKTVGEVARGAALGPLPFDHSD